jgi:fermentation-respiration switch protein FrsA (DUF1100 family)
MAVVHPGVKALILETPYTRLTDLAQEKMPLMLPKLLLRFRFDNLSRLEGAQIPLLVVHGTDDEVIPFHHGKAIYDFYKGPKTLLLIEGGQHNNLSEFPNYHLGVKTFLLEL